MSIRSQHFLGTARVRVRHLKLDPMKHVDEERVKRLACDFNRGGCRHHDVAHAVPALINPADLNAALARADLSISALFDEDDRPMLQFTEEEKPHVLYGDHRLRAAETLRTCDRWWSISLYDLGISAKDRARLLQLNRDKSTALNGRDLASFLAEEDQGVLDVWTSNMSKTHKSTFSQLKNEDSGKLSLEVQGLLRSRGLQYRMCNWEPILSMRCQEEVYAYLHAMAQTWAFILGTEVQPDQLDESTVKALEMYCPAYSSDDCDAIIELFSTNKVFPSVQGVRERENLGRRVLSCKRIVTFTSFSQDFIYLRTCFESLRQLLPTTWKKNSSFREAFLYNWVGTLDAHDESERQLERYPYDFHDCYIDLWLYSMRNFPYLSDGKASQPLQNKMQVNDHTEFGGLFVTKRAQLAYLASKHGFETDAIKKYKADHLTDQDRPAFGRPQVSCHDTPLEWKERSNRPSRASYGQYQRFLHREYVYDTSVFEQKKYATAYAIARDIVHCCWRSDIDRWQHGSEVQKRIEMEDSHV